MRCWNCNEELEEGSLYCHVCGEKQELHAEKESVQFDEEPAETKVCPYCKELLEIDAEYCIFCGRQLPVREVKPEIESEQPGNDDNDEGNGNKKIYKYIYGIVAAAAVIMALVMAAMVMKLKLNQEGSTQADIGSEPEDTGEDDENISTDSTEEGNPDKEELPGKEIVKISYEGALDAVNQKRIVIQGSVENGNILILNEKIDICALDQDGQPFRLNQVYYIQIVDQSADDFDFETEVGAEVELTGSIEFQDKNPVIFVSEINVLKEAIKEDAIHRYEVFVDDCTWYEAYQNCLRMGGYLARINSKEEFKYITKVIEKEKDYSKKQYYIGMRRDENSDAYYLVDENNEFMGERFDNGYTDWADSLWLSKEPSYYDSTLNLEETCVTMFKYTGNNKWVINDIPSNLVIQVPSYAGRIGYICEYDK